MSNSAPGHLASWNDGATKAALVEFVERVTRDGSADYVPPAERVAVFDNDGTLWCEKPMPIELGFILRRMAEMAEADPPLRTRQPWQAAYEKDYGWLGGVIAKHYQGDDSDVKVLIGGLVQSFADMPVETYAELAGAFPPAGAAPDARSRPPRLRLRAHDRVAALPRGPRVHGVHRLGRQPRFHAHDHPRHLRHSV